MMKAERLSGDRATSAAPGDAEVMGKVGSAPLWPRMSDQPQEVRSATDGPDLGRSSKAAFVYETWMSLLEKEVARRGS